MTAKILFIHSTSNNLPVIEGTCSIWNFSDAVIPYGVTTKDLPSNYKHVSVGVLLNTAAKKLKSGIVNIDSIIHTGYYYNSYLASSMGELNPYQNNFFLNLCRALILKDISSRKGQHIIFVDDAHLGDAFLETCQLAAISAKWAKRPPKFQNIYFFKRCRALGSGLRIALKHWYLGKKFKGGSTSKVEPQALWLINWADTNTFSGKKDKKIDAFYGELATRLEQKVKSVVWLANPMYWIDSTEKISEEIAKSCSNVLSIFEFITLKTIYKAILGWLMFRFSINQNLTIHGFNFTPIISYTARKEQSTPQIILALLYADVAALMAKENLQPKTIIYPYENQPWEKVLLFGFRRHCPSTRLLGMQHSPYAENYISTLPSSKQWLENTTPDILVTIGTEFYDQLIQYSAPKNQLEVGGYYRNPALTQIATRANRIREKNIIIFASCPMNKKESVELIQKTALATISMRSLKVVINFHPASGKKTNDSILKHANEITDCKHINFVEGPASKFLKNCALLIYNSSGTVFEAVSLGIPCIYITSENRLDLNKMLTNDKLSCRTPEELKKLILQLIKSTSMATEATQKAQKNLEYTFTKPNTEIWEKLI